MAILLGFILAAIGFVAGAGVTGAVRTSMGLEFWSTDMSWSVAYPIPLLCTSALRA